MLLLYKSILQLLIQYYKMYFGNSTLVDYFEFAAEYDFLKIKSLVFDQVFCRLLRKMNQKSLKSYKF